MFKSYTRKSSAIQGAKRAGLDADAVVQQDGQWGFHLPSAGLPKLGGKKGGGGAAGGGGGGDGPRLDGIIEATYQNGLSVEVAINKAAMMVCDRLGSILTDIRDVFVARGEKEADQESQDKLRRLEDDRESKKTGSGGGGILATVTRNAGGLLDILKMLSTPLIIGALTEIDKFFDIIGRSKELFSSWGGKFQNFLDDLARLPAFKDNIIGAGIRNLIPIMTGLGLFALWKPGPMKKAFDNIFRLFKWLGDNPALTGSKGVASSGFLAKVSRVLGKLAIPLTIIMSIFEAITGVIDGFKKGGLMGALEGGVDGLVNGLIGGLIDLVADGVGWLLEKFGLDGQRFKDFSFAKFLDAFGGGLGDLLYDLVENIKTTITKAFSDLGNIWDSDKSLLDKIFDTIGYPFVSILEAFKREFAGLSTIDMIRKVMSMATGNHLALRSLEQASRPTPAAPAAPAVSTGGGGRRSSTAPTRSPHSREGVRLAPNQGVSISGIATGKAGLEAQARKAGMTDAQIAYTYETDRLIGAPEGATLAQLKQESNFNNRARSETGATGISQFTNVGIDDVLFGRKAKTADERAQRASAKAALNGNTDMGLEYHRRLMTLMQSRGNKSWQETMRSYNGDTKLERNGMQARDNYMARIGSYMGAEVGVTPVERPTNSAALVAATEAARPKPAASSAPPAIVAPVNNNNSVSNVTQNHLPNMTASTPVEFAPFVT